MGYRPELDGIRAIAVAAVVLAHAGAPVAGGHLGVDIFFVLSGYLITRHILADLAGGCFSLRNFYARRVRRIVPALCVVAVACVPAAWLLLPPAQMELFGQGLVALVLFASNVLFWLNAGYFAPDAAENPLIHTWSLAVEEQFYLAFPLIMLLLWRFARRWTGVVLALLALASLYFFVTLGEVLPDLVFYLTPFRVWELMAGALVAWVSRNGWTGPAMTGPVGLLLIGSALVLGDHDAPSAWIWNLSAVVGTGMLLASAHSGTVVARGLGLAPLRMLGLISYSAYLWHQPVYAFARVSRIEPLAPLDLAGLIAMTIVLAGLTWWLVEQPFRRGHWPRPWTYALVVVVYILAGVGLAADLTKGLAAPRFTPLEQALFASAQSSPKRKQCHGAAHRFRDCVYGEQPPRWAVLGDSHGVELAFALGQSAGARGEGLLHLTASSCPPTFAMSGPHAACARWLDKALARLEEQPEIRTVVLTWRHAIYLQPDRPNHIPPKQYQSDLGQIVERLQTENRRVVVMAPVPELPRDVALHIRTGSETDIPIQPREAYDTRHQALLSYLAALPAEILYPANALCDAKHCYAAPGGKAAYFDDDHLSVAGARRVISPLLDDIQTAGAVDR